MNAIAPQPENGTPLVELRGVTKVYGTGSAAMQALRGVDLRIHTQIDRVEKGEVVLQHYLNAKREDRLTGVGAIVWAGAQKANDRLAQDLKAAGLKEVHLVGDALQPRRLSNAFHEGHRAARAV